MVRISLRRIVGCIAAAAALAVPIFAQSTLTLPGCEPPAELRNILEGKLEWKELQKLKYTDQVARRREVLGELIAKYPREVEPHRRLIESVRWDEPERLPPLQEAYRRQAAERPQDPLALYLAGLALLHTDSGESLRLFDAAKVRAPEFPWPSLGLAEIYSSAKFKAKPKATENIEAFFSACPASTDSQAQSWLGKAGDTALQAKVAAGLREGLNRESDPPRLKRFGTLWGLEFRTRPPKEHDALRKQVAEDVKRLETLNPNVDAEWMSLLLNGYKQAGMSKETIAAVEDRLLRAFPTSGQAFDIVSERWGKEHKEPEDQADATAWARYHEAYREAVKGWLRDFPEVPRLARYIRFFAVIDDDTVSEAEGVAAAEAYVTAFTEYEPPSARGAYVLPANFLLRHQWLPERALTLLRMAEPFLGEWQDLYLQDDLRSDDQRKLIEEDKVSEIQSFVGGILKAAMILGRPTEAQALKASIEGSPPEQKKFESDYWRNRARLATLEGRKLDALAYYQLALQTRLEVPKPTQGVLRDEVTDEAQALWKEMGGTETAWDLWRSPAGNQVQQLTEGRWEKATKQLPSFELADLSGKTWNAEKLKGKSVLINVWASW